MTDLKRPARVRLPEVLKLAMGPAPHGTQGRFGGAPTNDDVVSLLEENARLSKLVVKLSELVLRNVVDAKVTASRRWPTSDDRRERQAA